MIKLSSLANDFEKSAMQKSLNIPNMEKYILFALGLPDKNYLPLDLLKDCMRQFENNIFLQYSPPLMQLKSQIKDLVKARGIACDETEIFLTSGAQQGISLMSKLLYEPNSKVLTEELVYPGFLQVAQSLSVNILTVKTNFGTGIDLKSLKAVISSHNHNISFLYLVPDGNNPTGSSMDLPARKELLKFAKKYDISIIEDDPYGLLNYGENNYPALKSMDSDNVCYLGSFSKVLAPSLRVGWIIAPKHIMSKLSILKESFDIDTSTFSQRLVSEFIKQGHFNSHIDILKKSYKEKRDLMCNLLKKYFGDQIKFYVPENGIFIWVQFVAGYDCEILFKKSLEKRVLIISGNSFAVSDSHYAKNCIRLNFSLSSLSEIETGVKKLYEAFNA